MRKARMMAGLLFLAGGLLWAQFYASMDPTLRDDLAEDYYLVGAQYKAVGMVAKGQDFQDLAFTLNPGLVPQLITHPEPVSISEYLATADVKILGVPEEDKTAGLIRSRFLRLTGALIMEDAVSVLQNIDGSVYMTDMGIALSAVAVHEQLQALFQQVSLRGLPPSRIYDLGSLSIRKLPEQQTTSWGPTYAAEIASRMDLSPHVPIWTDQQRFYLRKSGQGNSGQGRWLIFAVGQRLPPRGWTPVDATDNLAGISTPPTLTQTKKDVESAFLACIEQFLAKDVRGALEHIATGVVLERLNVDVTREEIGATFQGYFDTSDFAGLTVGDLVNQDSVFVSSTDKYAERRGGTHYLLTVKTRLDLSTTIPFWTRFQEYYFTHENDAWKIFAIF